MKLIQGYVLALRKLGHEAFILAADGYNLRERLHAIGERRWTAFQKKNLSQNLRTMFDKAITSAEDDIRSKRMISD